MPLPLFTETGFPETLEAYNASIEICTFPDDAEGTLKDKLITVPLPIAVLPVLVTRITYVPGIYSLYVTLFPELAAAAPSDIFVRVSFDGSNLIFTCRSVTPFPSAPVKSIGSVTEAPAAAAVHLILIAGSETWLLEHVTQLPDEQ